jgi:hypothetical protein
MLWSIRSSRASYGRWQRQQFFPVPLEPVVEGLFMTPPAAVGTPVSDRVVIVGAGTGQMPDFLDPALFRLFRITCTDLTGVFSPAWRNASLGVASAQLSSKTTSTIWRSNPGRIRAGKTPRPRGGERPLQ